MFDSTFPFTRRTALKGGAVALAGLADLGFLSRLQPVSAAETQFDVAKVSLDPSIEPTVRLLEETPREKLLEEVASRIKSGQLNYQQVLAALQLAGVRNVQPRPSVGFKFHCVLVVNSAHLASVASPPEHRWLPIFWAIDYFKSAQAQDVREGNWTMGPVDEAHLPKPDAAVDAFHTAMKNWDESAADTAIAQLARTASLEELFNLFIQYGARDFRSIGHKAIFVANGFRTLNVIGRQHAEPVLRSLAYAILMHEGSNPAKRDDAADRPYRENTERLSRLDEGWAQGKPDDGATRELLATLRTGTPSEASEMCIELLGRGVSPQSLWDAQFLAAGEYLMQQPGIVALHASTTSNALRHAFDHADNDRSKQLALLQNAAFLTMFREAMRGRGSVKSITLEQLEGGTPPSSVDDVFAHLNRQPLDSAQQLYALLNKDKAADGEAISDSAQQAIDTARLLVFFKGGDSHDYKFSSAVLEDYARISPQWRNQFLAASLFKLRGADEQTNPIVERTQEALA